MYIHTIKQKIYNYLNLKREFCLKKLMITSGIVVHQHSLATTYLYCWHDSWIELILQVFIQLFLITVGRLLKITVNK